MARARSSEKRKRDWRSCEGVLEISAANGATFLRSASRAVSDRTTWSVRSAAAAASVRVRAQKVKRRIALVKIISSNRETDAFQNRMAL